MASLRRRRSSPAETVAVGLCADDEVVISHGWGGHAAGLELVFPEQHKAIGICCEHDAAAVFIKCVEPAAALDE